MITPIVVSEEIATMKKTPRLRSVNQTSGANGTAANMAIAEARTSAGAKTKRSLSAPAGIVSSLTRSLMASAIDWRSPNGPTRFGPIRHWMWPPTFRSAQIASIA